MWYTSNIILLAFVSEYIIDRLMNDKSKGFGRMFSWSDRGNNQIFVGENEETT
jgi:hypothetical protein